MRSAAMKFTGMLLVLLAALIVAQTPTAASDARSRDWTIHDGRLYVDGEWVFLKIGKPLCNFADPAACQKLGDTLDILQAKGFNALELKTAVPSLLHQGPRGRPAAPENPLL